MISASGSSGMPLTEGESTTGTSPNVVAFSALVLLEDTIVDEFEKLGDEVEDRGVGFDPMTRTVEVVGAPIPVLRIECVPSECLP